jgi:predicted CopG family antitoxin
MYACMATKTISIDIEAYERLTKARVNPDESFSRVIKRAEWREGRKNGAGLLAAILNNDPMSEETLDRLEKAQKNDRPPRDRWK